MSVFRIYRFFAKVYGNIVKVDFADVLFYISIDKDAVFTGAMNIGESDIFDETDLGIGFAFDGGDGNRLTAAPIIFWCKQFCVDRDMVEGNILNGALVAKLQGNTTVGAVDVTIFHHNIFEVILTL